ncbi:MAG: carbon storage regulator [Phycisphaerales bacterium]|nr:carbon storage regulator [Phycisphaerales bacterium]
MVIGDPSNPIGVIRIAGIKGDRVRVALEFPREIAVHRREVADQILSETPEVVAKIAAGVTVS